MKLADIASVKQLAFDIPNRKLVVSHDGELEFIKTAIDSLDFGASIVETGSQDEEIIQESDNADKKLLWTVLIINFSFFVLEMLFGLMANSMGLVADSMDMLADSFVYGLSLYAIAGTLLIKKRVARVSGVFQLLLAVLGFVEIFRRFIGFAEVPNYMIMILISSFALVANTISLTVLNRSKSKEVHIKASQIFTSNDIIANIGVIIAGALTLFSNSKIPDLAVGLLVFYFVAKGAIRILKISK